MDSRDSDEQEISSSSSVSRDSTSCRAPEYCLVKSYIQNALSLLESVSFPSFINLGAKFRSICVCLWELRAFKAQLRVAQLQRKTLPPRRRRGARKGDHPQIKWPCPTSSRLLTRSTATRKTQPYITTAVQSVHAGTGEAVGPQALGWLASILSIVIYVHDHTATYGRPSR